LRSDEEVLREEGGGVGMGLWVGWIGREEHCLEEHSDVAFLALS
jgi:hypothetical protein